MILECLGIAEGSVVVGRRPHNVHNVNCLDVALVRRMCVVCSLCGTASFQLRKTPLHLLCATLASFVLGN